MFKQNIHYSIVAVQKFLEMENLTFGQKLGIQLTITYVRIKIKTAVTHNFREEKVTKITKVNCKTL